jgi:hypothetical protein
MEDQLRIEKAKAYDLIATIEHCQRELQATNQKIAELSQKPEQKNK